MRSASSRDRLQPIVPSDGAGGVAVALRIDGSTSFFNYGLADRADNRPHHNRYAVQSRHRCARCSRRRCWRKRCAKGELRLDDPVAKIRRASCNKAATSAASRSGSWRPTRPGLLLPQDHPPWPDRGYTLPEFIRTLNAWTRRARAPGQQHLYTHAGFILLQLALERRYGKPIDELIERRLLRPLGMTSTMLARGDDGPRGRPVPRAQEPRGAGLRGRQRADRRARRADQLLPLAGDGPDVLLPARHGALPRRQSRRAADRAVAARRDGVGAPRRPAHRPAQPAGAGLGDHRRRTSPPSSKSTAASTTRRLISR